MKCLKCFSKTYFIMWKSLFHTQKYKNSLSSWSKAYHLHYCYDYACGYTYTGCLEIIRPKFLDMLEIKNWTFLRNILYLCSFLRMHVWKFRMLTHKLSIVNPCPRALWNLIPRRLPSHSLHITAFLQSPQLTHVFVNFAALNLNGT